MSRSALDSIPDVLIMEKLDVLPTIEELDKAINALANIHFSFFQTFIFIKPTSDKRLFYKTLTFKKKPRTAKLLFSNKKEHCHANSLDK